MDIVITFHMENSYYDMQIRIQQIVKTYSFRAWKDACWDAMPIEVYDLNNSRKMNAQTHNA